MSDTSFDLIVIGSGPAGYVCAIRAAQLGLKTACVEKDKTLGGTCLNVGCIPSKALLSASEKFESAAHHLSEMGIKTGKVSIDIGAMLKFKDKVVSDNTKGVEFLFKKNKVERLAGTAKLVGAGEVKIGKTVYKAKSIVIATGSEVMPLKGVEIDEKRIVSSTGALALKSLPRKLIVIGGGYIGLELGTVWRRLGAEVEVVEFLDRILPGMDGEVSKQARRIFEKQGIKFRLGAKVTGAKASKTGVAVTVAPAKGEGKAETLKADAVLVAIGRRPATRSLGLEEAGVEVTERGFIKTGPHGATSVKGVYAVGDCTEGPMLAHKGEDEGVAVAEHIAGKAGHVNYDVIPGIVYTAPEIAQVGKTEEQLKQDGTQYRVGKFPFTANGRARAMNAAEGFVKILADAKTDRILGCHIIGPEAGTLIAEVAAVMEFGASAEDVARTCHAHPTLNEAVREAALAVDGRALHI
jgi:dihydrolipoamide dehydrogenase